MLVATKGPRADSCGWDSAPMVRHTTALAGLSEKKIVVARSLFTGTERDVSNREDPNDTLFEPPRNSARNRFLLHRRRFKAPVGSNTATDDDCRPATFHRVASGVKPPSRFKNNRHQYRFRLYKCCIWL